MKQNETPKLEQFQQKAEREKPKRNEMKQNETLKLEQFQQKLEKEKPKRNKRKLQCWSNFNKKLGKQNEMK